jgi:hypothetical protein
MALGERFHKVSRTIYRRAAAMQGAAYELPRIPLPGSRLNKGKERASVKVIAVDKPEKDVDELKAEANLLMQTGQREEAKAILKALIEQNLPSKDLSTRTSSTITSSEEPTRKLKNSHGVTNASSVRNQRLN